MRVQSTLVKDGVEPANRVFASLDFCRWLRRTPNIENHQQKSPHNIYKMPIDDRKIKGNRSVGFSALQQEEADSLIHPSLKNVKTVKACSQIKPASVDSVAEGKGRRGIFNILTVHKESPQSNGLEEIISTEALFVCIKSMLSSVRCEIGPQQDQSVCFRQASPVQRNDTQRWPRHSDLYGGHQRCMHEGPL